ncbi:protein dispatched homolog 3-like [Tubulanus polymorphus]|uniref:protein dispatched homolog 3-like n=1 Tax=Tubulanus polymorphus TaxID=672921 RepID=UPI003DA22863
MPFRLNRHGHSAAGPLNIDATIGSDSDLEDEHEELMMNGEVNSRPPGVRFVNHSVVPPNRPCANFCRKAAIFALTNTFVSIFLLLFGVGLSLGPGLWSLISLEPKMTIDKSLKAFTIPNHKVMKHADALIVAVQHSSRFRKRRNVRSVADSDDSPSDVPVGHPAASSALKFRNRPSVLKNRQIEEGIDLSVRNHPDNEFPFARTFRFTQRQLRWRLQLAYVARDENQNIFTAEHLAAIHKIERAIIEHKQFPDFCLKLGTTVKNDDPVLRHYKGCSPPNSLLSYFYPSKDKNGVLHYDGLGSQLINVESALRFAMTHDSFYYFVGDQFNSTERKGNLIHTEIVFGAPLRGYLGISDRREEQDSRFRDFIISYIDLFKKASTDKVLVLYGGGEIFDYEVDHTFWNDMHLAEFSFASIVIIMLALTSFSLWLTWWGIVSIVLSFPMSIFFYRVVFGITSLGILNGAAAFVIIGIGVDDVFVFINIYRQLNHMKNDGERMLKTVCTAGKATLFTSFTTAAAFAANVASSIPAIHDFGLFMALMVACCWIMVMLIMPPALNIWSKMTPMWNRCFDKCCGRVACCIKNPLTMGLQLPRDIQQFLSTNSALVADDDDDDYDNEDGETDVPLLHIENAAGEGLWDSDEPLIQLEQELLSNSSAGTSKCDLAGRIQVLIYYFIAIPVIKARWLIFAIFTMILIICCVLVPQLHVATHPPQLFKPTSNLQQFYDLKANLSNSAIRCDDCSGLFTVTNEGTKDKKTANSDKTEEINKDLEAISKNKTQLNVIDDIRNGTLKASEKSKRFTSNNSNIIEPDHHRNAESTPAASANVADDPDNGSAAKDFKPCGKNGEKCKYQASAPVLETDAAVFVVFGILGIDRSNVSTNHVLTQKGSVIYDKKFENAFKDFPRMPGSGDVIKDLCRICKLFANNTELVKPKTAQCLPTYGIPDFIFNQYDECKNLPKNHRVYHQQLPVRALMGFSNHGMLQWMSFAFESTTKKSESYFEAYKQYLKWEEFLNHIKTNVLTADSPLQSIFHTSRFWEDVLKEIVAVSSAIYGLILSLFICTAAVAIFTGHIVLLAIIFVTIVGMILLVVAIFFMSGWEMGATEAVSLSILVGSSVDYCVHLVEGYLLAGVNPPLHAMESKQKLREWRTKAAASHIGVSILSSAITTVVAAIPLTQTMIQPFAKFGQIVTMNTTVSILYTLTVCIAFLAIFAPANYTSSCKSRVISILATGTVIGAFVLVLYVLSLCGVAIPGPSGESLFG